MGEDKHPISGGGQQGLTVRENTKWGSKKTRRNRDLSSRAPPQGGGSKGGRSAGGVGVIGVGQCRWWGAGGGV